MLNPFESDIDFLIDITEVLLDQSRARLHPGARAHFLNFSTFFDPRTKGAHHGPKYQRFLCQ